MRLTLEGRKTDLGKITQSSGVPCFLPFWTGKLHKSRGSLTRGMWSSGHPLNITDGGRKEKETGVWIRFYLKHIKK